MAGQATQEVMDRLEALKQERHGSWDPHWKEVIDYLMPMRGRFTASGDAPNRGHRRGVKILDSVGTQALRMLAAGMHGGLTPLSRPWFRLGVPDQDMQGASEVRQWLAEAERRIVHALAKSNFYETVSSFYFELAGIGTAVMLCLDDFPGGVRFFAPTVGEYYLAANAKGEVDTLYRLFWMTARQMEQQFGRGRLSHQVRSALDANPFTWFKVIHAVEPNAARQPGKADSANKPYASFYLEEGGREFLSRGGFDEQPFVAARWDVTGSDAYGRSPGMDVLGDIKMLQAMSDAQLRAVHLSIAPPLTIPRSLQATLNLLPGGRNVVDPGSQDVVRPIYQVSPNLQGMEVKLEQVRSAIRGGFFNDLFMTLRDNPDMTATEVAERHEEKLLLLGQVIERIQSEVLDPIVGRVFYVLARQGAIPAPPGLLAGQELKVEYVSMLAQAQKAVGTQNISRFLSFVSGAAQIQPQVLDKLDVDAAVDEYAEAVGVPPKLLVDAKAVARTRQARAQAQAAQAQAQAQAAQAAEQRADAQSMTSQARDLGQIPNKDNMFADLASALGRRAEGGPQ